MDLFLTISDGENAAGTRITLDRDAIKRLSRSKWAPALHGGVSSGVRRVIRSFRELTTHTHQPIRFSARIEERRTVSALLKPEDIAAGGRGVIPHETRIAIQTASAEFLR